MHIFQHLLLYQLQDHLKVSKINKQKSLESLSLSSSRVRRAAIADITKLETIAKGCPLTT